MHTIVIMRPMLTLTELGYLSSETVNKCTQALIMTYHENAHLSHTTSLRLSFNDYYWDTVNAHSD